MTPRLADMKTFLREGRHHAYRRDVPFPSARGWADASTPVAERVTAALEAVLAAEIPVVTQGERILFWRTVRALPEILTEEEWAAIRDRHFIHELGRVSNLSPRYAAVLSEGLLPMRARAVSMLQHLHDRKTDAASDTTVDTANDAPVDTPNDATVETAIDAEVDTCQSLTAPTDAQTFYGCVIRSIDAVLDLTERYRQAALAAGNEQAAAVLARVPARGARTFREALQSLRIVHFALWAEGSYHNTLGRFDQYMAPFLEPDLEKGILNRDTAFELLEEFFLCLNRDSDLYPGIQQGDNGQSLMLGGVDGEGRPASNLLTEMCLEASRELKLIDPKINLRVSSESPLELFKKGTLLTREGLGFPQYSNDDVVIPGLVRKGYALEDARDYAVAACWEFIIPGAGMDVPNIAAVNFPGLVADAMRGDLVDAFDYPAFFQAFRTRLDANCRQLCEDTAHLWMVPAPFLSLLMDGCLESGRDISLGAKYNQYGFHGVGLSTAVDSLAAIRRLVFEDHTMSVEEAVRIVEGDDIPAACMAELRYGLPKLGDDDDDAVDDIAVEVLDAFADATDSLRNDRGGGFRAGTGSAMFYLWHARDVGNALSGHRKGEAFSANYAPELFVRNRGPLSVIKSFTKPHLERTINGGPLTMEFHASLFRSPESNLQVASLVRAFILNGGHQLQLNAVNADELRDAQAHPENHRNLIVRIWGWSAYFVELDKAYQDHVMARQQFSV